MRHQGIFYFLGYYLEKDVAKQAEEDFRKSLSAEGHVITRGIICHCDPEHWRRHA